MLEILYYKESTSLVKLGLDVRRIGRQHFDRLTFVFSKWNDEV